MACTVLLTGCSANWNSIKHSFHPAGEKAESISIDAKQRVVISSLVEETETEKEADPRQQTIRDRRTTKIVPRICAEPSPDALSALASSLGGQGELSSEKVQAALKLQGAFAQSETAAYVGLRTQTIQLLRDGMYRLCEAYLSGALDQYSFNRLQRRYQNMTMGLLSIEQLTGAIVAPQVAVIAGGSRAEAGARTDDLEKLAGAYKNAVIQRSVADDVFRAAKREKEEADKALSDAEKTGSANETLRTAAAEKRATYEKAQAELAKTMAVEQAFEKQYRDGLRGGTATIVGGTVTPTPISAPVGRGDFPALAETVVKIVEGVVRGSFAEDECYLVVSESVRVVRDGVSKVNLLTQGMDVCRNTEIPKAMAKLEEERARLRASVEDISKQLIEQKRAASREIEKLGTTLAAAARKSQDEEKRVRQLIEKKESELKQATDALTQKEKDRRDALSKLETLQSNLVKEQSEIQARIKASQMTVAIDPKPSLATPDTGDSAVQGERGRALPSQPQISGGAM